MHKFLGITYKLRELHLFWESWPKKARRSEFNYWWPDYIKQPVFSRAASDASRKSA